MYVRYYFFDCTGRNFSESNIYIVEFSIEKNNCFLYIFNHYCYVKENFIGYIIIKNRMIAFYEIGTNCINGLVNKSLLSKDVPKKFPCIDELEPFIYEPKYVKYKVINKNSLKFINYGWL